MIKEFIEFVVGLKDERPITVTVGAHEYAVNQDRTLGLVIREPAPIAKPTLKVVTLTGLADALKHGLDGHEPKEVALQVIDPITVAVVALKADEHGRRHEYVRAVCGEVNPFRFGAYQATEDFLIALQSSFLPTENIIQLQRLASSLTSENSVAVADDGLSQVVTIKNGTVTREAVTLPPRIELFAYRTFREIDPTAGEFMVRLQGEPGKIPKIALLEIDAGKWKLTAMAQIAHWLKNTMGKDALVIA